MTEAATANPVGLSSAAAAACATEASPPPREVQLRLFPAHSPLAARLGAAFFRRVPTNPGVYCMRDDKGRLLYVGKAKDLRQRLNSYRYPARASRKTIRLLHHVHSIEWEECTSESDALLKENEMLRRLRPRFNRLGTWPQAYRFIRLDCLQTGFRLSLCSSLALPAAPSAGGWWEPDQTPSAPLSSRLFGAFKSGTTRAMPALLRLLWFSVNLSATMESLPRALLPSARPRDGIFTQAQSTRWLASLTAFLEGDSPALVDELAAALPSPRTPFVDYLVTTDLEGLRTFFAAGPRRNRDLCLACARQAGLIPQEQLDDLIVLANLQPKLAPLRPASASPPGP